MQVALRRRQGRAVRLAGRLARRSSTERTSCGSAMAGAQRGVGPGIAFGLGSRRCSRSRSTSAWLADGPLVPSDTPARIRVEAHRVRLDDAGRASAASAGFLAIVHSLSRRVLLAVVRLRPAAATTLPFGRRPSSCPDSPSWVITCSCCTSTSRAGSGRPSCRSRWPSPSAAWSGPGSTSDSGSLVGPWLSHLIVDAAIMAIGYDLVFQSHDVDG